MSRYTLISWLVLSFSTIVFGQRRTATPVSSPPILTDSTFLGLEFRAIGPAFMSGRIADIVIHPQDENQWYVAVGSGGVWKTVNSGVTWIPIFEQQTSYSIGCVTLDPSNPNVIWVGTGENVGGRHAGFGDGIYRSQDGGANWTNMGLKKSERISKIVVHPASSDIIWVAAQGSLWNSGGERGLYKSIDGGVTWKRTLGDDQWTGVTDVVIDPGDPDRLYAATWQRQRTVAAYMGGGPGSGIHRSVDGGESWTRLSEGLPSSDMGKIGLAIDPRIPDVIYAAIELDRRKGGVFRSTNGGGSWEKRSDAVAGATGPHYYQELYASPHYPETLYLVDFVLQVSRDGGKTFNPVNYKDMHVDFHAVAFKKSDPDYLLVGTDGGVYESFDNTASWRFMENLPVTQFYKVALDDAEPFYHIYGGTQDNSTQGGPSRTDNRHGIQNSDWRIVLDWDGHQPATEPGNPDIMYAERQEGTLSRVDLVTGEVIDIQPQPAEGEDYERFNWDAPILVSPHSSTRIYFASQRLWRSENRGDSWTAISPDLTRNQERMSLPIMGRTQSWDAAWDLLAMSNYNTITSIAESPAKEDLIYVGTDDGIIQVTEDGGQNWRRIEVGSLPGVPGTAFVNDIKADLRDPNVVYVALDNHKYGDFRPFLVRSSDRGRTWTSISSNIPDRHLVWRVVQDHVNPQLLFGATEFGIFFTVNGGGRWTKLSGGLPTISFRDLAIQRRENDLVGASFGRGFFVLDDYSPLRMVSEQQLAQEATLFSVRKAWWYIEKPRLSFDDKRGTQGSDHFVAPNPPFGAVFTYYLRDGLKTQKELRQEREKPLKAKNQNIPWPGWDEVEAERRQDSVRIWLNVTNHNGETVRRVRGPVSKGFHRVAWDLRYPPSQSLDLEKAAEPVEPRGFLAVPGTYSVTLFQEVDGVVTQLSDPQSFDVVPLRQGALEGSSPDIAAEFWRQYEATLSDFTSVALVLKNSLTRVTGMQLAISRSLAIPGELDARLHAVRTKVLELDGRLHGNRSKLEPGEKTKPLVSDRLAAVQRGIEYSTYGPTPTHLRSLEIAQRELRAIRADLTVIQQEINSLSADLVKAGAPWVEAEKLPEK